jgi:cell division protein FtsL
MSKQRKNSTSSPIFRLRSMILGIAIVSALITGPLLMVWKQVYITSTSLKLEKMSDSLAVYTKNIARLNLRAQRLSSNERIERIARSSLELDYPVSDQIVIVEVPHSRMKGICGWPQEFVAFIKKSLWGDRG